MVLVFLWISVGTFLGMTSVFSIGWLEWTIDLMGGLASLILTWFLFPPIISLIIAQFLPSIAGAVEARHYQYVQPPIELSIISALRISTRYLGLLVIINFALLPLLILGPVFPFVFYTVNGYLLGREYFDLVALRRISRDAAKQLYLNHRCELFIVGIAISIILTLPLVNLLAPVLITTSMVHLFEGWLNSDKNKLSKAKQV